MSAYQITPKITHESLGGEVIAIHFDTGAYYSLRGSAARIWEMLAVSSSNLEMIADHFAGGEDEVAVKVEGFLRSLCEEGLIEETEEAVFAQSEGESGAHHLPFEEPVFERFDDMRELLLADPIHDVDEGGWPHVEG